jgi:hypothetical protein
MELRTGISNGVDAKKYRPGGTDVAYISERFSPLSNAQRKLFRCGLIWMPNAQHFD